MITKTHSGAVAYLEVHDRFKTRYEWANYIYKPSILERLFGSKEEDRSAYYNGGEYSYFRWDIGLTKDINDTNEPIDGVIWEKPHVKVYANSGDCIKTRYFDTLKEVIEYCNKKFPNINIVL